MLTVESVIYSLTDFRRITEEMKSVLRNLDPHHPLEEANYHQALQRIYEELPQDQLSKAKELLMLQQKSIAANLLFLLWNGLHWNLHTSHHPQYGFTPLPDYEILHKESAMLSMPASIEYRKKADSFFRSMSKEQKVLFNPIASYYAYIQTTAYKLAHYFGFALGNELLPVVVPNYSINQGLSSAYRQNLQEYLDMDLFKLIA